MMSSDSPIRAWEGLDLLLLTYTPPGWNAMCARAAPLLSFDW